MRTCSESHAGLDADAQRSNERREGRVALLACVVDDALIADEDRVEALHLPSLVPVFLLGFLDGVADDCLANGEFADGLLESDFVEQIGLYITDDAVFGILERLKSCFGQSVGQQLARRLQQLLVACYFKGCGEVIHNICVKFLCKFS